MKKKEKRMILILIIIAVVIIATLLIIRNSRNSGETGEIQEVKEKYVDVLSDGTKLNKSNKLSETKNLDGMEISNIQLTHKNGSSVLLGDVKNTTSRDIDLTEIEITLFDDSGNTLTKLDALISPVKAGEIVQLNCGVSSDYANAYDFSVVKK